MELYLIRHTTPDVPQGICYGQTDLEVTGSFEQELAQARTHLPQSFDKVYCSPLQRCLKLAKALDPNPTVDRRLKEMHFGSWEMQPWDDLPEGELNPWMDDFVNVTVPGGESFRQLINRSREVLEDIEAEGGRKIGIVTHAGVIRAMLGHFLSLGAEHVFKLQVDYAGVCAVSVHKGRYTVRFINR